MTKELTDRELWRKAIENEDVYAICKQLFGIELYGGQEEIVRDIVFDKEKRLSLLTPSQYGKTWAVAAALGAYILLHKDKNIVVISGTQNQARIMRDKFAEFLADCPMLAELVDTNAKGVNRLKKEASKKRITFKNGCELRTLTAGGNNDAESLMGFGGDLIIADESNLISDEIYEKRILRMLGNSSGAAILQIGNPTTRNHFYEVCKKNDRYKHIHVDHKQAVEEGSFTQEYVDEMREEMSEREFRVNIMAEFPEEDAQNTLFKWSWLENASNKSKDWDSEESDRVLYGLDVARAGEDSTVLTRVEMKNGVYAVTDTWKWDLNDTMEVADNVHRIMESRNEDRVNVDAHGIGSGVLDRLRQKGDYAVGIKVGAGATHRDRFLKTKAEKYWKLRECFEDGDVVLCGDCRQVMRELDDMDFEYNARDKIRIVDPDRYSPDFADSLMLAVAYDRPRSSADVGSARSMY